MGNVKIDKKRCHSGLFKPGNTGRPKGVKNKFTNLKDSFIQVFERLGGADGLYEWVNENKRNKETFYHMITKMLPTNATLSDPDGGPINGTLKIVIVKTDSDKNKGNGNGNGNES